MKEKPPPGAGAGRPTENTAGTRGFIAPAVVVMCLPLEKGHLHVSVQKTRAGDLSNAGANHEVAQSVVGVHTTPHCMLGFLLGLRAASSAIFSYF